ncbi:hypothetical protein HRbin16_02959 [bacterium HR16]|nr:hypothetical protein HRbin16_02959 [bacterium HR16]
MPAHTRPCSGVSSADDGSLHIACAKRVGLQCARYRPGGVCLKSGRTIRVIYRYRALTGNVQRVSPHHTSGVIEAVHHADFHAGGGVILAGNALDSPDEHALHKLPRRDLYRRRHGRGVERSHVRHEAHAVEHHQPSGVVEIALFVGMSRRIVSVHLHRTTTVEGEHQVRAQLSAFPLSALVLNVRGTARTPQTYPLTAGRLVHNQDNLPVGAGSGGVAHLVHCLTHIAVALSATGGEPHGDLIASGSGNERVIGRVVRVQLAGSGVAPADNYRCAAGGVVCIAGVHCGSVIVRTAEPVGHRVGVGNLDSGYRALYHRVIACTIDPIAVDLQRDASILLRGPPPAQVRPARTGLRAQVRCPCALRVAAEHRKIVRLQCALHQQHAPDYPRQ